MSPATIALDRLPEIRLADLPGFAARLADRVRTSGFAPDVIVYVERGARLLATELCREFACSAIAIEAKRGGVGVKRFVAPMAAVLPQALRDAVRRCEERWFWQRGGGRPRRVISTFDASLAGRRVLLVDDAADSGRTIAGCRFWLAAHGVPPEATRVAVLGATTPAGRASVDFWILERNTRLPWSSDSRERSAAELAWREREPPKYAPGDL